MTGVRLPAAGRGAPPAAALCFRAGEGFIVRLIELGVTFYEDGPRPAGVTQDGGQ